MNFDTGIAYKFVLDNKGERHLYAYYEYVEIADEPLSPKQKGWVDITNNSRSDINKAIAGIAMEIASVQDVFETTEDPKNFITQFLSEYIPPS
jgi:hypothetical protein